MLVSCIFFPNNYRTNCANPTNPVTHRQSVSPSPPTHFLNGFLLLFSKLVGWAKAKRERRGHITWRRRAAKMLSPDGIVSPHKVKVGQKGAIFFLRRTTSILKSESTHLCKKEDFCFLSRIGLLALSRKYEYKRIITRLEGIFVVVSSFPPSWRYFTRFLWSL